MRHYILIILLAIYSCVSTEHEYPRLDVEGHDTIRTINSKVMLQSLPPLLAVDFIKDTVAFSTIEQMHNFYNRKQSSEICDSIEEFRVIVDTSYNFSNRGFIYRNIPQTTKQERLAIGAIISDPVAREEFIHSRYQKQADLLKNHYIKSYPVLIYNNSKNNLCFGLSSLLMIQEALDVDSIWKPIEFTYQMPMCGIAASMVSYSVRPKHYLATSIIKYKGNFKTKMRLNVLRGYKSIYSNEFVGFINRSQFETRPATDYLRQLRGEVNYELDWMLHKPTRN